MIDGVNTDYCSKRVIGKREGLTRIAVVKMHTCVQSERVGPRVGGSDTARVDVYAGHLAADCARQKERGPSRPTGNLQDMGSRGHVQPANELPVLIGS